MRRDFWKLLYCKVSQALKSQRHRRKLAAIADGGAESVDIARYCEVEISIDMEIVKIEISLSSHPSLHPYDHEYLLPVDRTAVPRNLPPASL